VVTMGGGGVAAGAEADPEAEPDWAGVAAGEDPGVAGVDDCADTRNDDNRRTNNEVRWRCMVVVGWDEGGVVRKGEF